MTPNEIIEALGKGHRLCPKNFHPGKYIESKDGVTQWQDGTKVTLDDLQYDWEIRGRSFLEIMAVANPYNSVKRVDWPSIQRLYVDYQGRWILSNMDYLDEEDLNSLDWEVVK